MLSPVHLITLEYTDLRLKFWNYQEFLPEWMALWRVFEKSDLEPKRVSNPFIFASLQVFWAFYANTLSCTDFTAAEDTNWVLRLVRTRIQIICLVLALSSCSWEKNLGLQINELQSSFMACSLRTWRFTSAPNLIANFFRIWENTRNLCCRYQIHCFVCKITVFLEKTRFCGLQMHQNGSYWL